jgi:D-inositol-3-phosphate glycosyltransferase
MQVRRVAMLCVHTSPLEQPGTGDAGGLNVYVSELSRELAARGVAVDLFTRATRSDQAPVMAIAPGVRVLHVLAGPFARTDKLALTGELCAFAADVMRVEAARGPGYYDVIHSHYWLSGQAGAIVRARWGIPLVHSMHTLAKVKNATLPYGDLPEPPIRLAGETEVAYSADRLVANSEAEATALVTMYGADPSRVVTVHPGVDLDLFRPGDQASARQQLGMPADADVLLFVGRLQPLKAPDMVLRAAGELLARDPSRRLSVVIVGGPSGSGTEEPGRLRSLARELGVSARFEPPVDRAGLVDWYRAADVTVVPSRSETFGLVALESQASGTPVVAASVGGLQTAVRHGRSGYLVSEHDQAAYADAIQRVLGDHRFRPGARTHAERFSWHEATDRLLAVYADAHSSLELSRVPEPLAYAAS